MHCTSLHVAQTAPLDFTHHLPHTHPYTNPNSLRQTSSPKRKRSTVGWNPRPRRKKPSSASSRPSRRRTPPRRTYETLRPSSPLFLYHLLLLGFSLIWIYVAANWRVLQLRLHIQETHSGKPTHPPFLPPSPRPSTLPSASSGPPNPRSLPRAGV